MQGNDLDTPTTCNLDDENFPRSSGLTRCAVSGGTTNLVPPQSKEIVDSCL